MPITNADKFYGTDAKFASVFPSLKSSLEADGFQVSTQFEQGDDFTRVFVQKNGQSISFDSRVTTDANTLGASWEVGNLREKGVGKPVQGRRDGTTMGIVSGIVNPTVGVLISGTSEEPEYSTYGVSAAQRLAMAVKESYGSKGAEVGESWSTAFNRTLAKSMTGLTDDDNPFPILREVGTSSAGSRLALLATTPIEVKDTRSDSGNGYGEIVSRGPAWQGAISHLINMMGTGQRIDPDNDLVPQTFIDFQRRAAVFSKKSNTITTLPWTSGNVNPAMRADGTPLTVGGHPIMDAATVNTFNEAKDTKSKTNPSTGQVPLAARYVSRMILDTATGKYVKRNVLTPVTPASNPEGSPSYFYGGSLTYAEEALGQTSTSIPRRRVAQVLSPTPVAGGALSYRREKDQTFQFNEWTTKIAPKEVDGFQGFTPEDLLTGAVGFNVNPVDFIGRRLGGRRRSSSSVGTMTTNRDGIERTSNLTVGTGTSRFDPNQLSIVLPAYRREDNKGWAAAPGEGVVPVDEDFIALMQHRLGGKDVAQVTATGTGEAPSAYLYGVSVGTGNVSGVGDKYGYAPQGITYQAHAPGDRALDIDVVHGEVKHPEIKFADQFWPGKTFEQRTGIMQDYLQTKYQSLGGMNEKKARRLAANDMRKYQYEFVKDGVETPIGWSRLNSWMEERMSMEGRLGKNAPKTNPLSRAWDVFNTVFRQEQDGSAIKMDSPRNLRNLDRFGAGIVQNDYPMIMSEDTKKFYDEAAATKARSMYPDDEEKQRNAIASLFQFSKDEDTGMYLSTKLPIESMYMETAVVDKMEYAGAGRDTGAFGRMMSNMNEDIAYAMGISPDQLGEETPATSGWRDLARWLSVEKTRSSDFEEQREMPEELSVSLGGDTEEGRLRLTQMRMALAQYNPSNPGSIGQALDSFSEILGGDDVYGTMASTGVNLPTVRSMRNVLTFEDQAEGTQKGIGAKLAMTMIRDATALEVAGTYDDGGEGDYSAAMKAETSIGNMRSYLENIFSAKGSAAKSLSERDVPFSMTMRYDAMTMLSDHERYIPPPVRKQMMRSKGFGSEEIAQFEKDFQESGGFPDFVARSPDIGGGLLGKVITDSELYQRRAAGARLAGQEPQSREDFDKEINGQAYKNVVFMSPRASEVQTGDFDRDIATMAMLVEAKKDDEGKTRFKSVTGIDFDELYSQNKEHIDDVLNLAYENPQYREMISATGGAYEDLLTGKDPLGKGKSGVVDYAKRVRRSVDERTMSSQGMGSTYNIRRAIDFSMATSGFDSEAIEQNIARAHGQYQPYLDFMVGGTGNTSNTPISSIIGRANWHLDESGQAYVGMMGASSEPGVRNKQRRMYLHDPLQAYSAFQETIGDASQQIKAKGHDLNITQPELMMTLASTTPEMLNNMREHVVGGKYKNVAEGINSFWDKYTHSGGSAEENRRRMGEVIQTPLVKAAAASATQKRYYPKGGGAPEPGFGNNVVQATGFNQLLEAGLGDYAQSIMANAATLNWQKQGEVVSGNVISTALDYTQKTINRFEDNGQKAPAVLRTMRTFMERIAPKASQGDGMNLVTGVADSFEVMPLLNKEKEILKRGDPLGEAEAAARALSNIGNMKNLGLYDLETFAEPGAIGDENVLGEKQIPWQISIDSGGDKTTRLIKPPKNITKADYEASRTAMLAKNSEVGEHMPSWERLQEEGVPFSDIWPEFKAQMNGRSIGGFNTNSFDDVVMSRSLERMAEEQPGNPYWSSERENAYGDGGWAVSTSDFRRPAKAVFKSEIEEFQASLKGNDSPAAKRLKKYPGSLKAIANAVVSRGDIYGDMPGYDFLNDFALDDSVAHDASADVRATKVLMQMASTKLSSADPEELAAVREDLRYAQIRKNNKKESRKNSQAAPSVSLPQALPASPQEASGISSDWSLNDAVETPLSEPGDGPTKFYNEETGAMLANGEALRKKASNLPLGQRSSNVRANIKEQERIAREQSGAPVTAPELAGILGINLSSGGRAALQPQQKSKILEALTTLKMNMPGLENLTKGAGVFPDSSSESLKNSAERFRAMDVSAVETDIVGGNYTKQDLRQSAKALSAINTLKGFEPWQVAEATLADQDAFELYNDVSVSSMLMMKGKEGRELSYSLGEMLSGPGKVVGASKTGKEFEDLSRQVSVRELAGDEDVLALQKHMIELKEKQGDAYSTQSVLMNLSKTQDTSDAALVRGAKKMTESLGDITDAGVPEGLESIYSEFRGMEGSAKGKVTLKRLATANVDKLNYFGDTFKGQFSEIAEKKKLLADRIGTDASAKREYDFLEAQERYLNSQQQELYTRDQASITRQIDPQSPKLADQNKSWANAEMQREAAYQNMVDADPGNYMRGPAVKEASDTKKRKGFTEISEFVRGFDENAAPSEAIAALLKERPDLAAEGLRAVEVYGGLDQKQKDMEPELGLVAESFKSAIRGGVGVKDIAKANDPKNADLARKNYLRGLSTDSDVMDLQDHLSALKERQGEKFSARTALLDIARDPSRSASRTRGAKKLAESLKDMADVGAPDGLEELYENFSELESNPEGRAVLNRLKNPEVNKLDYFGAQFENQFKAIAAEKDALKNQIGADPKSSSRYDFLEAQEKYLVAQQEELYARDRASTTRALDPLSPQLGEQNKAWAQAEQAREAAFQAREKLDPENFMRGPEVKEAGGRKTRQSVRNISGLIQQYGEAEPSEAVAGILGEFPELASEALRVTKVYGKLSSKQKEQEPELGNVARTVEAAIAGGVDVAGAAKRHEGAQLLAGAGALVDRYKEVEKFGQIISDNFEGMAEKTEEQLKLHEKQTDSVKKLQSYLESAFEATVARKEATQTEDPKDDFKATKLESTAREKRDAFLATAKFLPKEVRGAWDINQTMPNMDDGSVPELSEDEQTELMAKKGSAKRDLGAIAREMFGGFGLMYLKSALGNATSAWGEGQASRLETDKAIQAGLSSTQATASIGNQLNKYENLKAAYGTAVNPMTSMLTWAAGNPGAQQLGQAGWGAVSSAGAMAWLGDSFSKSKNPLMSKIGGGVSNLAIPIAIAAQLAGLGIQGYDTIKSEPGNLGRRTGAGFANGTAPSISDVIAYDIGGAYRWLNKDHEIAQNFDNVKQSEAVQIRASSYVKNGKTFSFNDISGDASYEDVFGEHADTRSRAEKDTDAFHSLVSAFQSDSKYNSRFSKEIMSTQASFESRNSGLELTETQRVNMMSASQNGVDFETLARQALSGSGVSEGKQVVLNAKEVSLSGQLAVDLSSNAALQSASGRERFALGSSILAQSGAAKMLGEDYGISKGGGVADSNLYTSTALRLADASPEAQARAVSALQLAKLRQRAGESYDISRFEDALDDKMTPDEIAKWDAEGQASGNYAQQKLDNAQAQMNQDYTWEDNAQGGKTYDLMMRGGSSQRARMGRLLSGDPMMLAIAAQNGLDLSSIDMPALDGRSIGGEYAAFTDLDMRGKVTGMAWGSSSFNLGNVSAETMTGRIFGQDWKTNPNLHSGLIQAGLTGEQLLAPVITPDGNKVTEVGGEMGIELKQMRRGREIDLMQRELRQSSFNLGIEYTQKDWNLDDRMRNLSRQQEDWNFGFSQKQMDVQENQWQVNVGMQRQQSMTQRNWTVQDWSVNAMTRDLQWGWKQEDYAENSRFMTGRDRRLAERQMKRDTTMHNIEGDQIDVQKSRQQELWKMEDERFTISKLQHAEDLALQQESMATQRKFTLERRKLEDEQIKNSRERWAKDMDIQKRSIELTNKWNDEQYQMQATMKHLEISTKLTTAQLNILADDSLQNVRAAIVAVGDDMVAMINRMSAAAGGSKSPMPTPGATPKPTTTTGGGGGSGNKVQAAAAGGRLDRDRISVVGEEGWEYLIDGVVIPHDKSVAMMNAGIGPGTRMADATKKMDDLSFGTSFAGNPQPRASENKVINVYIGNELLKSYVVETVAGEIRNG